LETHADFPASGARAIAPEALFETPFVRLSKGGNIAVSDGSIGKIDFGD
jgi:hypothetical protein